MGESEPAEEIKAASPEKTATETTTTAPAKKSLFGGSKKNVFNPFAKKVGKPPGGSDNAANAGSAVGSSFTKESNVESDNRFGAPQRSGGFGDNSFSGAGDKSKLSAGNISGGFDSQAVPKNTAPTML